VTALNAFSPNVTKVLVILEKWDYPETAIKQQIWRNFLLKLINLTTFLVIAYDGLIKLNLTNIGDYEASESEGSYFGPENC